MMVQPAIKCCPFCGAQPVMEGTWVRHPAADCLMSEEVLFDWTAPASLALWNRRAGDLAGGAA